MDRIIGLIGLVVLLGLAFVLSNNRKSIDKKLVAIGIGMQIVLALLILGIPALNIAGPLQWLFAFGNDLFLAIIDFTNQGSTFLFRGLMDTEKSGFIFAFQVLPTIIFMASVMAVFYHWGIMQKIVGWVALAMQKLLGTSGAETLSVAANIFVGQTESPIMVKPYIDKMTKSELLAVMIGGMATVAGGVMAAYVGTLKDVIPGIAGHLLTASVMSAPAALVIAKIMMPETGKPETKGTDNLNSAKTHYRNSIDAVAQGASEGLMLALNVAAMLLAFIALVAAIDFVLIQFGEVIGFSEWGKDLVNEAFLNEGKAELSTSIVLGWLFAPLAFIMGIPWSEVGIAGSLLGQKVMINEFYAYMSLADVSAGLSERSMVILSYALCGFANFSSIGIQIGGIGGLAPKRKGDLAELGIRAVIGGSLAAFLTATIAGILI